MGTPGTVLAVHAAAHAPARGFAKPAVSELHLVVEHGAHGDRHAGRARRQVHLVDVSRYDLLRDGGADVGPGHLGENVTTRGVDLLALGLGARLRLGEAAVVRVTGTRHPRHDDPATDPVGVSLDPDGVPVGRVGVFAVVEQAGTVRPGDAVTVLGPGDGTVPPPL